MARDVWKQYALQTGRAFYVAGSDADDIITVDFVTEPGLLRDIPERQLARLEQRSIGNQ